MTVTSTCWTMIRDAAAGDPGERDRFVRVYEPVVRAYLQARWGKRPEIDDATQEIFLACFTSEGVLERADPNRSGGFQAYFLGVIRNIARRFEERRARQPGALPHESVLSPAEESTLSRSFDRAWAKSLMREAARLQAELAAQAGREAIRRVELLRLRFHDGLPIREIARRWNEDAARLHHAYARARKEFATALRQVVEFHVPGTDQQVEQACRELLELLR